VDKEDPGTIFTPAFAGFSCTHLCTHSHREGHRMVTGCLFSLPVGSRQNLLPDLVLNVSLREYPATPSCLSPKG
jgi:hypothetical protein